MCKNFEFMRLFLTFLIPHCRHSVMPDSLDFLRVNVVEIVKKNWQRCSRRCTKTAFIPFARYSSSNATSHAPWHI